MRRWFRPTPGAAYYILVTSFLYLPLALLVFFSFNDATTLAFPFKGFTLRWYAQLIDAKELLAALRNSLIVGVGSSLAATLLGTMEAIAVTHFQFPGRGLFLAINALPLVIPYVVLGVALLLGFSLAGIRPSLLTVAVGHTVICTPYVVLIVTARLALFEPNLEEAAMDLGSTYWGTLARVTLPLAWPALAGAFLTSFTTSLDEFALSFFLTGNDTTLPIYLYSQLRFPQRLPLVVALAAVMIVLSVLLVVLSERLRRVEGPWRRSDPGAHA
jgi:spermidine/putrescine transport system permease protein